MWKKSTVLEDVNIVAALIFDWPIRWKWICDWLKNAGFVTFPFRVIEQKQKSRRCERDQSWFLLTVSSWMFSSVFVFTVSGSEWRQDDPRETAARTRQTEEGGGHACCTFLHLQWRNQKLQLNSQFRRKFSHTIKILFFHITSFS